MRILYINWAPIAYGSEVGGGVNSYCRTMASELVRRGHDVWSFSSGFSYTFSGSAYIKRSPAHRGVKNYELVNSEIIAPSICNFPYPEAEIEAGGIESLFGSFLSSVKPDLVHFHNIEGLSSGCRDIAGRSGARVLYSLHNYHLLCSRVDLLFKGSSICDDFEGGKKCLSCSPVRPRKLELLKRIVSRPFFRNRYSAGRKLWHGMQGLIIGSHARFPGVKSGAEGPELPLARAGGGGYAQRRRAMVEAVNRCDRILAVSCFVRDLFVRHGVSPELITVNSIGNRLAGDRLAGDRLADHGVEGGRALKNSVDVVFIGVADRIKGLPFLVDALCKIASPVLSGIRLHLYAAGIDHQLKIDREFSKSLERVRPMLSGLSIFDGYRFEELPEILGNMDMGIVPPLWYDNAPQVVLELLSMKVPVLGARIGGIPDFVKHGENGMLFEPGNACDLMEKLESMVFGKELLTKLREGIGPVKTVGEHCSELESFYSAGLK